MTKLKKELSFLERDFEKLYDPATAFGNLDLIAIREQIELIETQLETHDECDNCDGYGFIECSECGHDRECTYCEKGLIEKQ